nr:hypothetical protein [uncultured Roseateles sp.]
MTSQSKAADIEAILLQRFPLTPILEALEKASLSLGPQEQAKLSNGDPKAGDFRAQSEALRSQLNAMPAEQVARLADAGRKKQRADAAKHAAERQAKLKAQEKAKEDARFYNLAGAGADFVFWCMADFWTLDEAVALLLGREPRVVNPEALKNELKQSTGFLGFGGPLKPAEFHRTYDGLRKLMERAEALASPRLRPRAVLNWAERTGAAVVPAKLEAALSSIEATAGSSSSETSPAPVPQPVTAVSRTKGQVWTPEELDELRRHKDKNGTKSAAEKYGMSEARVRALIPNKKAAPVTSHPLNTWVHRAK